jgi:hypothetical protein
VAAPLAAITSATAPTTTGMRSGPFVLEVYCAAASGTEAAKSGDIPARWPTGTPFSRHSYREVKTRLWVGILGVGGLAPVLLGLSMLAASETTTQALQPPDPFSPALMEAQAKAYGTVLPTRLPATVNITCGGKVHMTEKGGTQGQLVLSTGQTDYIVRQARCLHRHGFLSSSDLASILTAPATHTRKGLGRIVPLSLQVRPSSTHLALWSVLLSLELVAVGLFARSAGRRRDGALTTS